MNTSHFPADGTTYDVVIVGAGAVGSALALQLSQADFRVALLDCHTPNYAQTNPERVIALSQGSVNHLQALGVWQSIKACGTGLIQSIHAYEAGNTGFVDMCHDEINAEALGYVVEIRHVLQPLHTAMQGKVDMLSPAQCTSITTHENHTTLQLNTKQGSRHIHASLLVAADGSNSPIRQMAGINTTGWEHNRTGIVASVACQHGHQHWAYECFKPQGPLALLPLADGRLSLVWSVNPRRSVELMLMNDADFLTHLSQAVGADTMARLGDFSSVGKRACFPLELRLATSFAQAGLVLVGNAAHTIHPVAGQGMNLGLRDVAVLADILQQDWAKGQLHSPMLAQTYAERRRLDTLAVTAFTEGMLATFSTTFPPLRWLRGQGLKFTQHTSPLKQLLLQQASGMGQIKSLTSPIHHHGVNHDSQ